MSDTDPSSVIAVGAVMPILGIIAVALRFYVRKRFRHTVSVDDWILIPALLLTIGMGVSLIAGVRLHALGYPTPHTGDPNDPLSSLTETNSAITITSQVEWALQLMQVLALGCIKLSFLFFYRRVLVGRTSSRFRHITWGLIIIVILWTVSFFFAILFACKGNWSAWWGSVMDLSTKCVHTLKMEMALVTTDFITDVMVILLPIPKIWGLHLSIGRKVAVSGVFLLGLVAVAASAVRMNQFIQVITIGLSPHADEDLSLTANLYWSMVESGIGLIAVCLPTYRSLLGHPSLQSLVASVRSTITLRSPSHSSSNSHKAHQNAPMTSSTNNTDASADELVHGAPQTETWVVRDNVSNGTSEGKSCTEADVVGIRVQYSLTQVADEKV